MTRLYCATGNAGKLREFRMAADSARVEIEPPLQAGKLRGYFNALVTGEDVEHRKPAPDPYLLGARLLGARLPLVVEDSPTGIASGRAAGFEVLCVTSASSMPAALLDRLSGGCPQLLP